MKEEEIINMITTGRITWEGLIRDIIIDEGIDPWDVDIIKLANRFRNIVEKVDIRVAGKFILISSILLSMKSEMMFREEEEEIEELLIPIYNKREINIKPKIQIKRKRPITLNELISALKKAIEVSERRKERREKVEEKKEIKIRKINIKEKIERLYEKISNLFKKINRIPFSKLVPSWRRVDIVWTFIPLIHLAGENKVELEQEKEFGEIYVRKGSS